MKRYALLLCLLLPGAASAHSREAIGFTSGFLHPFFGIDHLLAMLSVGVISARAGRAYIWLVPALFVSFMLIGGILGMYDLPLPLAESGIAFSVLVLGIGIIFVNRSSTTILIPVMVFVAFFGSLHGYAHGAEMPASLSPLFYSIGFVVSTSLIHLIGVYIGALPGKLERFARLHSYVGSAIAAAGVLLLFGQAGS